LVEESPFIGSWVGTVVDVPLTFEFQPDGDVVLSQSDGPEITGTYEYATDESVLLITFADFPEDQEYLGAWLSRLHAELRGDTLELMIESPIANVSIDPAASVADVESFVQTLEADVRVARVDVEGPEGEPPVRVVITLESDANTQDFSGWLAGLPEYAAVDRTGVDHTYEGALGGFTRVVE